MGAGYAVSLTIIVFLSNAPAGAFCTMLARLAMERASVDFPKMDQNEETMQHTVALLQLNVVPEGKGTFTVPYVVQ